MGDQLRGTRNPVRRTIARAVSWAKAEPCDQGNLDWLFAPWPLLINMHSMFCSEGGKIYTWALHPESNKKIMSGSGCLNKWNFEHFHISMDPQREQLYSWFLQCWELKICHTLSVCDNHIRMLPFPYHEQTDVCLVTLRILWFCSLNSFVFSMGRGGPTEVRLPSLVTSRLLFFPKLLSLSLLLTVMRSLATSLLFNVPSSEVSDHDTTRRWSFG